MSAMRLVVIPLFLLIAATPPMLGQEPRLSGRVPEAVRARVDATLDAARARGLPVEPLVDRALEGAAKGAPPAAIVAAVTRLMDELVVVSRAFGETASTAELTAGASALRAGAGADDLARLRRLRPGRPLTVAAAVMADLVAAGVAADTAVGAVLALANNADDADYVAFRRNVQRDIELGASPAAALAVRIRSATDLSNVPGSEATPGTPARQKRKP
jgi:hypothetical protein